MLAYLPGWDPVPQPYRDVTLDLSHTATAGSDALQMAADLGDRLRHLHLADGLGSAKDEHLIPGRGGQPCAELLGRLAEREWSGTVVVEVSTRRCRTRAERTADLAEALAFARLHLAAPKVPADGAGTATGGTATSGSTATGGGTATSGGAAAGAGTAGGPATGGGTALTAPAVPVVPVVPVVHDLAGDEVGLADRSPTRPG